MNIELKILNKEFYRNYYPGMKVGLTAQTIVDDMQKPEIPFYATPGSAGMDLRITHDVYLHPNIVQLVGTGIAVHIGCSPSLVDYAGFIYPRSGLGHKGVVLGNNVAVIDEDYQGEIKLSLLNRTNEMIKLQAGDRVAQLVFQPIIKARFDVVEEFSNTTERGVGGYGSTGK